MAIKLHRCRNMWIKVDPHPCWRVQKALDNADVDYEVVKHPALRGRRKEVEELSGQKVLPVIELEDGTVIREESNDLVNRIEQGKLKPGGGLFRRGG
jgi:glutathione S-transferase